MQSHPIADLGTDPGTTGDAPQPPGEAAIAQFLGGVRFDAQPAPGTVMPAGR